MTALMTGIAGIRGHDMAFIDRLTIKTAWLPDIAIDKPLEKSSEPNAMLDILKPSFIIESGYGKNVVMSPYGEPGETNWPIVKAGLLGVAALGLFMMFMKK
jgi:hypothetical protein